MVEEETGGKGERPVGGGVGMAAGGKPGGG
jgi:hypothetical protein